MERKKSKKKMRSFPAAIALGILAALLVGAGCLLICGAIAWRAGDPAALIMPLALVSLAISSVSLGIFCTRFWGHGSPIPALVGGAIYAVLILAGGLAVPGSTLSAPIRFAGCPAIFLLSAAGGLFLSKKTGRSRRRRHHS